MNVHGVRYMVLRSGDHYLTRSRKSGNQSLKAGKKSCSERSNKKWNNHFSFQGHSKEVVNSYL